MENTQDINKNNSKADNQEKSKQKDNDLTEEQLEKAEVQIKKVIIEDKKYEHPSFGVYDEEGRKVELEADYSVKASPHQIIKSYIKMFEAQASNDMGVFGCFALCIAILFSVFWGFFTGDMLNSLGMFIVLLAVIGFAYIIRERVLFNSKVKEIAEFIIANELDVNEFMIVADKSLEKDADLRKYLVKVNREVNSIKLKNN